MITYQQALTRATSKLAAHPDLHPTALQDAAVLLMHLLQIPRATLIAHPERTLDREQQAAYQRLLERRLTFEPIQYILGEVEFYGLTLRVTPAVLIPRPETELLVEAVLERIDKTQALQIIDIGTGSGTIAIALAAHLPQSRITAVDLSAEALAIASENARLNHLEDRIHFLESDLLAALPTDQLMDAIVSNPPYIPQADAPTLHPQVRDFEPKLALFAGEAGFDIYQRLIPQALPRLKPNGLLALEIGHGQRDAIAQLLSPWQAVEFLDDLQGIPRVALARRPE